LLAALERVNKKRDIVVLVFGEVDCRFHINYQYMKTGIPMSDLIDRTIINYSLVIREIRDMGYNVHVCNIVPASWRENEGFPYYGDAYTRSWVTKVFNERLKGVMPNLVDVYTPSADSDGFMRSEFGLDDVHLNSRIIPYVRRQLHV